MSEIDELIKLRRAKRPRFEDLTDFEIAMARDSAKASELRVDDDAAEMVASRRAIEQLSQRRSSMLRNYGITQAHYDEMLKAQKHRCAICDSHVIALKRQLFVDHCHRTGAVRGLLCMKCNLGLGAFEDRPARIIKAVDYLERSATAERARDLLAIMNENPDE